MQVVLSINLSHSVTPADIDECALPTGGHICSYRCHNTPGSFHCSCPDTGYTLAPNGRSCQGKHTPSHKCQHTYQQKSTQCTHLCGSVLSLPPPRCGRVLDGGLHLLSQPELLQHPRRLQVSVHRMPRQLPPHWRDVSVCPVCSAAHIYSPSKRLYSYNLM